MAERTPGKASGRPEGGTIRENVKLTAKKKIKVDPEFSMPNVRVKEIDNHEKFFRCCMCGRVYTVQKGNFLSGGPSPLWKGNNGYIPFCKSCTDTLMNSLTSFYSGNEEHALRHMCHMFDWYYCDTASAMTLSQVQAGKSRIALYPSKACTRQVTMCGETFLDTIRDDSKLSEIITDVYDLPNNGDDSEDEFVVTREMIKRWGHGYSAEQYQYLEEEYQDWCAKNVCNTKTQQVLYKNIAIAQLNIRTAQQNGGTKLSEAMKALQDLMNSANILPKQTAENVLADTQTFGTLLKKYEETRPVPEPAPEWKDVDGIRKYTNTWVRGGLGKALRIRNEHTALYDEAVEEMERYTVRRESFVNSAEGMGSAVFDNSGTAGEADEHDQ